MADPTRDVSSMSDRNKISAVLTAVADRVPAEIKDAVLQLVTPEALEVISGVILLWGVSHFFGFGEVFDLLIMATGIVALGTTPLMPQHWRCRASRRLVLPAPRPT